VVVIVVMVVDEMVGIVVVVVVVIIVIVLVVIVILATAMVEILEAEAVVEDAVAAVVGLEILEAVAVVDSAVDLEVAVIHPRHPLHQPFYKPSCKRVVCHHHRHLLECNLPQYPECQCRQWLAVILVVAMIWMEWERVVAVVVDAVVVASVATMVVVVADEAVLLVAKAIGSVHNAKTLTLLAVQCVIVAKPRSQKRPAGAQSPHRFYLSSLRVTHCSNKGIGSARCAVISIGRDAINATSVV